MEHHVSVLLMGQSITRSTRPIDAKLRKKSCVTVFALAVMEYAVDVSKFGKNPMTLLVHQY